MRKVLYGVWLCLSLSGAAAAQTISAEGQARAVSLMVAIQTRCAASAKIDREVVDQYAVTSARIGQDLVGEKAFNRLATKEIARRQKEVDATGASMWCAYQRPNLDQIGLKAFVD